MTKPALYAQFRIPHYWRIELDPPRVTTYHLGSADRYEVGDTSARLTVTEPFDVDLTIPDLVPNWAKR